MIIKKELINIDSKLMSKYLFTINCLVCGKTSAGKSLFINKILGENKCMSFRSEKDSLTSKIVKYIHSELPITVYDTPGFNKDEEIDKVEQLILDKNKNLKEQKNKIHFIFFLMNIQSGRGFSDREITFIQRLLKEKIPIQIIRETSIAPNDFLDSRNQPTRDVQDPATIAWNLSTTMMFKAGCKPWKLANIRKGVCYIGLVFKKLDK